MFAVFGSFFASLGMFIINAIVACGSAAGLALILAIFLCTLTDIKLRHKTDTDLEELPSIGLGVFLGVVVGLVYTIWVLRLESTGQVIAQNLGIAVVLSIALGIIALAYDRIKKASAPAKVADKGEYPRQW
jgi:hypothetical protein